MEEKEKELVTLEELIEDALKNHDVVSAHILLGEPASAISRAIFTELIYGLYLEHYVNNREAIEEALVPISVYNAYAVIESPEKNKEIMDTLEETLKGSKEIAKHIRSQFSKEIRRITEKYNNVIDNYIDSHFKDAPVNSRFMKFFKLLSKVLFLEEYVALMGYLAQDISAVNYAITAMGEEATPEEIMLKHQVIEYRIREILSKENTAFNAFNTILFINIAALEDAYRKLKKNYEKEVESIINEEKIEIPDSIKNSIKEAASKLVEALDRITTPRLSPTVIIATLNKILKEALPEEEIKEILQENLGIVEEVKEEVKDDSTANTAVDSQKNNA